MGGQTAVWTLKNPQFFSTNKNSKGHTRTLTLLHAEERGNQHEIRIAIFERDNHFREQKTRKNNKQITIRNYLSDCETLPWMPEACLALSSLSYYTPLMSLIYSPLPRRSLLAFGRPRHLTEAFHERNFGTQGSETREMRKPKVLNDVTAAFMKL